MPDSGLKHGDFKEGIATITAGNTFVDVTHGFYTTPRSVMVEPDSAEGVDHYVPDANIGAVTFRISISAAQSVNVLFKWIAAVS